MSSHKSHLKLSPEAQEDFIGILRYTGERWGHEQLLAYRDKLNDALMLLHQNPQLGHQAGNYLKHTGFTLSVPMLSCTEHRNLERRAILWPGLAVIINPGRRHVGIGRR